MKTVFPVTISFALSLCVAVHSWAAGQEYLDDLSSEDSEFHSPFNEEVQTWHSDDAVFEEDLPPPGSPREEPLFGLEGETSVPEERERHFPPLEEHSSSPPEQADFGGMSPPPPKTPPFMSRPSEWELTPPTVIDAPPLPSANLFAERELVALKFIEEGKAHFDHEEWELAREQFERAISIAPLVPYSYYFLGRIAFAERDLKSALAFLQKAELLLPRTNRAWLGETTGRKGIVYEDLKDYKQARTAYRRSLRFEPANLKVLSALARLPEEESTPHDAIFQ